MHDLAVLEEHEAVGVERLEVAPKDFPGIQTYTTVEEMLEQSDVNLITIITPHNLHAEQTIAALKAGKDVFVEKPLAMNRAEFPRSLLETLCDFEGLVLESAE